MLHEKFINIPSIPEIRAIPRHENARDYIQLMDWPGFIAMLRSREMRVHDTEKLADRLEEGDELHANAIEASMSPIEANLLLTTGASIRNVVAGACPNVQAYIMGNPYNMRNKVRDKTGRGPLSLFIEMTGSGGLSKEEMIERGAALFAMVRALSIVRPLELWVTTTFGGYADLMTMTAIRLETNPLDLQRAACLLTSYDDIMRAGYRAQKLMTGDQRSHGWAYAVPELERKWAGEILGRMISPGSQIAYMPAGLLGTDDFGDPNEWIKTMLREYSPYLLSGDDQTQSL